MGHRFKENQTVIMMDEKPEGAIKKGFTGNIFCLYNTAPPAYEVTFRDPDTGKNYSAVMYEEQLGLADEFEADHRSEKPAPSSRAASDGAMLTSRGRLV